MTDAPSSSSDSRPAGDELAMLAVAGLLAGISACAGAQNEAVVDTAPPLNTQSAHPTTAPVATAETVPVEDLAPRKKPRADDGQYVARASDCCKGRNECKGKGNCKTDHNDCAGKNECKSKGGCRPSTCDDDSAPSDASGKDCCKGKNDCKGLGGCKTDEHACKGMNNCKGLGGCKSC